MVVIMGAKYVMDCLTLGHPYIQICLDDLVSNSSCLAETDSRAPAIRAKIREISDPGHLAP